MQKLFFIINNDLYIDAAWKLKSIFILRRNFMFGTVIKRILLYIIIWSLIVITYSDTVEEKLSPSEIMGKAVYIPFPVNIKVDGKLDDWMGVRSVYVDRGKEFMISKNPEENGSFTFSVAADKNYLYITMEVLDNKIITGQHGRNFWNEDSMEFFINASGNLVAKSYSRRIFQVNITASDIGNTDPHALTLTGVNCQNAIDLIHGYVFKTEDGWGYEVALNIKDLLIVEHGNEFGFQAQMNGATGRKDKNRDVKLIWSLADKKDTSWRNPSLFGRGIFFEIGRKDIPEYKEVEYQEPEREKIPAIALNQTGYSLGLPKIISINADAPGTLDWLMKDHIDRIAYEGESIPFGHDKVSGNNIHYIDITKYDLKGKYYIEAGGFKSYQFVITDNIYSKLRWDALAYFYHNRSGLPILEKYVGKEYARPAGHRSDNAVVPFQGPTEGGSSWKAHDNYVLDVSGGWYDAGDWGKYVVNGGIAVWTLLNQYETNPANYKDGDMKIPENQNKIPDILDEARWELEFLLKMQVPEGKKYAGWVHHKMHNRQYEPPLYKQPETMDNDNEYKKPFFGRYLYPPTTAATLNMTAVAAQGARLWKKYDKDFYRQCIKQAEIAWNTVYKKPIIYAGNIPGAGGGNYSDQILEDEYYWAACELYITTGKNKYKKYIKSHKYFMNVCQDEGSSMSWNNTATLGTISLILNKTFSSSDRKKARQIIIATADEYLKTIGTQGYRVPITKYYWGSNSFILNNAMIMGFAYKFTGNRNYVFGMAESIDYLMGHNPLGKSYISGYGENPLQHPHHRFWANIPEEGYPFVPPGVVAGGPNRSPDYGDYGFKDSGMAGQPEAKLYADSDRSFSTNEVTINWNAPLAWVTAFLGDYLEAKIEIIK